MAENQNRIDKLEAELDDAYKSEASLRAELAAARERCATLEPAARELTEVRQRLEGVLREIEEIRKDRDQFRDKLLEATQRAANKVMELEKAARVREMQLMEIINAQQGTHEE
jgi:uncharacterized coiled-coil DUF342 family protein